jgi:hypothetical protein
MEFPDRTTPVTSRIFLYSGTDMRSPEVPPPPQLFGKDNFYFEEVLVKVKILLAISDTLDISRDYIFFTEMQFGLQFYHARCP